MLPGQLQHVGVVVVVEVTCLVGLGGSNGGGGGGMPNWFVGVLLGHCTVGWGRKQIRSMQIVPLKHWLVTWVACLWMVGCTTGATGPTG